MRKDLISPTSKETQPSTSRWLELENQARVEFSSEDPERPIESALRPGTGPGWRAGAPGPQTIRIIFDAPVQLRQIYLEFQEPEVSRTQEFVLRWSPDPQAPSREIVRQQFTFAPPGTPTEREEYQVNLTGVRTLELYIIPDQGGAPVRATLARLLLL
jgi:hypothetical protein